MRHRKYFLDLNDLQYKQIRLPLGKSFMRGILWLAGSVVIALLYGFIFNHIFGSPKQKLLSKQIEALKLQYSLAEKQIDNSMEQIKQLKLSDEIWYRPALNMDSLPESYRNPGFGGIDRFSDMNSFTNGEVMKSARLRIEEMRNMIKVQSESFTSIEERSVEWKYDLDHLPAIRPVDPKYRLGDGFMYREVHPVTGIPQWHYGQDFEVPYGTKVFATGDGKVVESGSSTGGFGNVVMIDHGNGLMSIYAHLSKINVPAGINVKRGDLLGLSGSSGSSTGPHLHYQINKFGQHVDANNYFSGDMNEDEFNKMIQAFQAKSKFNYR